MALEQTLSIIKPDGVTSNSIGRITAMIEEAGLQVIAAKMLHLSVVQAEELYAEHKGKPFFDSLLGFMTSGPVMVMVLEGQNAIKTYRQLMGATRPEEAATGTIRNLFANLDDQEEGMKNVVHGSDSEESAMREIDFFFDPHDICPRT